MSFAIRRRFSTCKSTGRTYPLTRTLPLSLSARRKSKFSNRARVGRIHQFNDGSHVDPDRQEEDEALQVRVQTRLASESSLVVQVRGGQDSWREMQDMELIEPVCFFLHHNNNYTRLFCARSHPAHHLIRSQFIAHLQRIKSVHCTSTGTLDAHFATCMRCWISYETGATSRTATLASRRHGGSPRVRLAVSESAVQQGNRVDSRDTSLGIDNRVSLRGTD